MHVQLYKTFQWQISQHCVISPLYAGGGGRGINAVPQNLVVYSKCVHGISGTHGNSLRINNLIHLKTKDV